MRFDPENDPFEQLNDPEMLDDTPIGTLRVVPWGHAASVAIMDDRDPTLVRRIVHTLRVGESPLDAVYGRRVLEDAAVREIYARRDAARAESDGRDRTHVSKDFVNDMARFRARRDDGSEAIAMLSGAIPWDVRG